MHLLIVILSILIFGRVVASCDIYVAPNYNTNNTGSMSSPFGSIHQALNRTSLCSSTVCTICVAGGVYVPSNTSKHVLLAFKGTVVIRYMDWTGSGEKVYDTIQFLYNETSLMVEGFQDINLWAKSLNNESSLNLTVSHSTLVTLFKSDIFIISGRNNLFNLKLFNCTIQQRLSLFTTYAKPSSTLNIIASTFSGSDQYISESYLVILDGNVFEDTGSYDFYGASLKFINNKVNACSRQYTGGCITLSSPSLTIDSNKFYGNNTFANLDSSSDKQGSVSITNNHFDCIKRRDILLIDTVTQPEISGNTFGCALSCPEYKYSHENDLFMCWSCYPGLVKNPQGEDVCNCHPGQIWTSEGCRACSGQYYTENIGSTSCKLCEAPKHAAIEEYGNTGCKKPFYEKTFVIVIAVLAIFVLLGIVLVSVMCVLKRKKHIDTFETA